MPGLIVHEWVEATGGAERVVDAWAEMYPDAEIGCLWADAPERYAGRRIRESWLARTPLRRHKGLAVLVMWLIWRRWKVAGYDWILVSSHSFAHHIAKAGRRHGVPVYVYVHTPARYLWAPELDPRAGGRAGRLLAGIFRRIDRLGVDASAHYVANSRFIAERCRLAWGVEPEVIYPPVDRPGDPDVLDEPETAIVAGLPSDYVVAVSRFAPQKRLDLALEFATHAQRPLVLCGRGPEEDALRQRAAELGTDVTFVISPSDNLMARLIRDGEAFVFPPVEDFGIIPVEAQLLGCPAIVNEEGGAAESLQATGGGATLDFDALDAAGCTSALERARAATSTPEQVAEVVARAEESFGTAVFADRVAAWMGQPAS
ncbi:glycosyltransferase [Nocardioides sp.]|uniref:glycosyltransferase n=1 Tax=Nocardioides sp. TaxID=35761 RepID=UPI003513D40B